MLVQIDYELRFDAPFHLGTGVTAGEIDRTVIHDKDGYLYVPASTFKGVLREHCEQLCRFYVPNEPVASPHDAYARLTQFGKAPSLITRIFGSSLHPGGLRFDDATQQEGSKNLYRDRESKVMQTIIATQARIDRLTRTAANEALYTSEFGARDLTFHGTIKGPLNCSPIEILRTKAQDPTPSYSLLLLIAGLLLVERMGGNKSAGKGQCNCSITRMLLDRQLCTTTQWEAWIERLDEALDAYASNEQGGEE